MPGVADVHARIVEGALAIAEAYRDAGEDTAEVRVQTEHPGQDLSAELRAPGVAGLRTVELRERHLAPGGQPQTAAVASQAQMEGTSEQKVPAHAAGRG